VFNSNPDYIIVCEGEWDALVLNQFGYPAITRTGAARVWDAAWGQWFNDMVVYVCHDCDKDGQTANNKVAASLARIADVRVVTLPYPITKDHGKDITDFFTDNDPAAFKVLLEEARPLKTTKSDVPVETVTVLDTFDARHVGDPVRIVVTVKGRKEPGYTIPSKVRLLCTQDAGQKCASCPLNAASGLVDLEYDPSDAIALALMDATQQQVSSAIADSYGIPGGRCARLQQEILEYRAVEVLFARPALDYSDGTKAGEYKNIKITSVGRHDTIANNTVAVVGALHPNPRDQRNEFLGHEIEYLQTAVDRFELNGKTVNLMKRFQAEAPLRKVASISKSLAEHVTHIHGRPEMHALMDLTFHSVLSFKFAGELVNRGWLEGLVIGDTRTGKSLAAERLVRHFGGGEIISCEAATFAGVVGGLQQMGGRDWASDLGNDPHQRSTACGPRRDLRADARRDRADE
jgi:hypothetical protein